MNGTFSALMSTNEVYRDLDRTRCLTLDIEDLESAVEELDSGKAEADHDHDEDYAAINHTHETFNLLWQHPDGEGYYMNSQTVTPSKPLNQCAHGWILCWSDYDPDTTTTNSFDQCFSIIPKKNAMNANWHGEGYLCVVPVYADENGTIDNICLKNLNVYNDKIVGKTKNYMGNNRRDAVLRCIYEF